MIEAGLFYLSVAALIFSFYRLFLANNAMVLGVSLLRVSLAVLAVAASRFEDMSILTTTVLLFILLALLVMALVRNEAQINHD